MTERGLARCRRGNVHRQIVVNGEGQELPCVLLLKGHTLCGSDNKQPLLLYTSVSQPPGRGPVPGPGINNTGPREFVILVF